MYCKVKSCTTPFSHTTRNHICEKCEKFGHGLHECGNLKQIIFLKFFWKDILPNEEWCTIKSCKFKRFHNNTAHYCDKCLGNHDSNKCIITSIENLKVLFNSKKIDVDFEKILSEYNDIYIKFEYNQSYTIYIVKKNYNITSIYDYDNNNFEFIKKYINNLTYLGVLDNFQPPKLELMCPQYQK